MLEFFIIFIVIGYILGRLISNNEKAIIVILVISIIWMFVFGFWAIATLIELSLGYLLAKKVHRKNTCEK